MDVGSKPGKVIWKDSPSGTGPVGLRIVLNTCDLLRYSKKLQNPNFIPANLLNILKWSCPDFSKISKITSLMVKLSQNSFAYVAFPYDSNAEKAKINNTT